MPSRTVVVGSCAVALALAVSTPASAARSTPHIGNPNASCAGLALSEHAVNDGPAAIKAVMAEVKALAEAFGFANSGQVMSRFAQVHAGTHEPGCEEAIVNILTQGP